MTDKPKRKNDEPNLHRYWWIFSILAILLFFYPIRILSDWWINPILYSVLMLICFQVMIRFARVYFWKRTIMVLLFLCTLLAGFHSILSIFETGHCYVEDIRYSQYIACYTDDEVDGYYATGYQQIASFPIGMSGYCWYAADKPLTCLAYRLQLWSPILMVACGIHYIAGRKRRNAEGLIPES